MSTQAEMKYDWVLIEDDKAFDQGKTEAGIYVPSQMSEDLRRGKVVAIGIGKCLEDGSVRQPQTQPGAYVLFQDVGHCFMVKGRPFRAIKEEDIVCELVEKE